MLIHVADGTDSSKDTADKSECNIRVDECRDNNPGIPFNVNNESDQYAAGECFSNFVVPPW